MAVASAVAMGTKWSCDVDGNAQCADGVDPRNEIVAYLRTHPAACDSLDGIVDWWLPRQRYETARAAIQQALNDLVGRGVVEQIARRNGMHLYRLAGERV